MKGTPHRIVDPGGDAPARTAQGVPRPLSPDCHPRLLDLHAAGDYLGVSYWQVRDYVQNGTIPAVKLPASRVDTAPRRNGKPTRRVLLGASDPRLGSLRRILVDVRDLDALIERTKERAAGSV